MGGSDLFLEGRVHVLQQQPAQVLDVCLFFESLQSRGPCQSSPAAQKRGLRKCSPSISLRKSAADVPLPLPERCPTASPIKRVILLSALPDQVCIDRQRRSLVAHNGSFAATSLSFSPARTLNFDVAGVAMVHLAATETCAHVRL